MLIKLSKTVYDHWRDMLNILLVNSFQWDRFLCSEKGSLYKYSPFNLNTLDSLINQYFYLPQKNQLNDPIEMLSQEIEREEKLLQLIDFVQSHGLDVSITTQGTRWSISIQVE
ncbi:hypothetical protein VAEU17_4400140 [Vibrio aestuarianus]|nr:hypothetical protein VAEU17_4400140 [Vibrio aestuarianus]